MTRHSRPWLAVLVWAALAGCATYSPDGPRLQGFDLINEGADTVSDVQIRYGDYVFPAGDASAVVRVPRIKGPGFHQGATVPIPATARIHWLTVDGQRHDVTVPISDLISDRAHFHGVQFIFVDEHVELAFVYEREPPAPDGMDVVRVYSSASVRDLTAP
jgi:hypothetical protein